MTKVTLNEEMQDFLTCGSSAPVRAEREGGAAAWATGVLAAPGTQEDWWLGQQEI